VRSATPHASCFMRPPRAHTRRLLRGCTVAASRARAWWFLVSRARWRPTELAQGGPSRSCVAAPPRARATVGPRRSSSLSTSRKCTSSSLPASGLIPPWATPVHQISGDGGNPHLTGIFDLMWDVLAPGGLLTKHH
jgi:hypothetical protein